MQITLLQILALAALVSSVLVFAIVAIQQLCLAAEWHIKIAEGRYDLSRTVPENEGWLGFHFLCAAVLFVSLFHLRLDADTVVYEHSLFTLCLLLAASLVLAVPLAHFGVRMWVWYLCPHVRFKTRFTADIEHVGRRRKVGRILRWLNRDVR